MVSRRRLPHILHDATSVRSRCASITSTPCSVASNGASRYLERKRQAPRGKRGALSGGHATCGLRLRCGIKGNTTSPGVQPSRALVPRNTYVRLFHVTASRAGSRAPAQYWGPPEALGHRPPGVCLAGGPVFVPNTDFNPEWHTPAVAGSPLGAALRASDLRWVGGPVRT